MARNATNTLLQKAKKSKSDEFYTQLSDIESELQHYKNHFKNKVVYCNCDDPTISNFFKYFALNSCSALIFIFIIFIILKW